MSYNRPIFGKSQHTDGCGSTAAAHNIDKFVDGDMDEVIQALIAFERAEQLLHLSD